MLLETNSLDKRAVKTGQNLTVELVPTGSRMRYNGKPPRFSPKCNSSNNLRATTNAYLGS